METDNNNFNDGGSDAENVSPNANGGGGASFRRRRRAVSGGGRPASAATAGPLPASLCRSLRPSPKAPAPLAVREEKRTRVRDVACDPSSGRVASLTTHGALRIWDAHLNEVSSWQMANDRETVCVTMGTPTAKGHGLGLSRGGAGGSGAAGAGCAGLVLAGSQAHVQLYDVRLSAGRVRPGTVLGGGGGGGGNRNRGGSLGGGLPSPIAVGSTAAAAPSALTLAAPSRDGAVAVLESPDGAHGVRSIEIRGHLLSIGTGRGRIAFADVRQLGKGWADLGPAPLKPVGVAPMGDSASLPPPRQQQQQQQQPSPPSSSPRQAASLFPPGLSTPQRQLWQVLAQDGNRGNGRRPLAETNAMPPVPQDGDRDFGLSLHAAASLGVGAGTRHPHPRPETPPSPPGGPRAAAEAARAAALAAWPLASPPADPISLAAAFEQQLEQQLRDSTVSGAVAAAATANAANNGAAVVAPRCRHRGGHGLFCPRPHFPPIGTRLALRQRHLARPFRRWALPRQACCVLPRLGSGGRRGRRCGRVAGGGRASGDGAQGVLHGALEVEKERLAPPRQQQQQPTPPPLFFIFRFFVFFT